MLYLIPFLHQTTTREHSSIVPERLYLIPFLHQTTTILMSKSSVTCCILFHFYIKPQLGADHIRNANCCILFHFYIKPQQIRGIYIPATVVSYSISTSNHNFKLWANKRPQLYLIPFLHQTTTLLNCFPILGTLYLIPFLHQTTTL